MLTVHLLTSSCRHTTALSSFVILPGGVPNDSATYAAPALSGLADRMMALLDQVEEWSARMGWDSSMVGLVIGADGFVRWAIRNAGGSSVSWDIYFIAQLAELVESPEKVRRWYRTVEGWVRNGRAVMNKMKVRMIGSEGRVKQERESELTFPDEKIE
uniref:Uncharacterized protein n=1 Tax=Globodera pallida TaxID=36090 RepID=A0A183C4M6_GLOPA